VAKDVLLLCAENVQSHALQIRLAAAASTVEAEDADYRVKGPLAQLYLIASTPGVGEWVDGPEMERLYTGTLARRGSAARHIYDTIKTSARHNICPACGQRLVTTLDHYLPKTSHPALAVAPHNLLPCCGDCNKIKLDHLATSAGEQTLHPYFDNVDDATWLIASVIMASPPALLFGVNDPPAWPALKSERVRHHFKVMQLGPLYAAHAGEEIENLRYQLQQLHRSGGAGAVRDHLLEQEATRRTVNRNSWQAAMYAALAASDWFCQTGVHTI
jgi:hypothetical protein